MNAITNLTCFSGKIRTIAAAGLAIMAICGSTHVNGQVKNRAERKQLADSMEYSLVAELLKPWYPKSVDTTYGGFLSNFSYDFRPTNEQEKMIVTQARHTWVNSKASKRFPKTTYFKSSARHGFQYLRDVMWDKEFGGFYTLTDREGRVQKNGPAEKEAYGNAFGIYALSGYYLATKDTSALSLAKKAFLWLEKHSHDPVYKGYFQHLKRNGDPIVRTAAIPASAATGYKDQNSSIHLLEAFTELYAAWPDPLVKKRLEEMLLLIRDTMVSSKGYLVLFFQPDWTPVSFVDSSRQVIEHNRLDYVSFGHDVETAYLMLEASHALGLRKDSATLNIGKKMVDHALHNGWDAATGGFYDEGYYFKGENKLTILHDTKNWWAQAEGLNTLLMMADLYPNDPMQYFAKFKQQWLYIKNFVIDHQNGDWFEYGLDKSPDVKTARKGHIWKATYHNYRSLANCIDELRKK